MAPSALPIESAEALTTAAVKTQIQETTPTQPSPLAPLDASKLIFTRNTNPQAVPDASALASSLSSICTDHMITAVWYVTFPKPIMKDILILEQELQKRMGSARIEALRSSIHNAHSILPTLRY